jgi:hypothetical protein
MKYEPSTFDRVHDFYSRFGFVIVVALGVIAIAYRLVRGNRRNSSLENAWIAAIIFFVCVVVAGVLVWFSRLKWG